PELARKAEDFLGIATQQWEDITRPLPEGHLIATYTHLMTRVEAKHIDALFDAQPATADTASPTAVSPPSAAGAPPDAVDATRPAVASLPSSASGRGETGGATPPSLTPPSVTPSSPASSGAS